MEEVKHRYLFLSDSDVYEEILNMKHHSVSSLVNKLCFNCFN